MLLLGGSRCHKSEGQVGIPAASAASRASGLGIPSVIVAPDAGPAVAPCPDLDAKLLAPFELDTKLVSTLPPAIVDEKGVLAHLYERLASLARATATDHVRIGVYGDSNMTMDFISGQMRRVLATRFGDAGHGYVALGRPWPWYLHQDVRHDVSAKGWRMFATSTHQTSDGLYGFANIAAESAQPGAVSWVQTAADTAPIGKTASHFDVYYLKRPAGGAFQIKIDGKVERTVVTANREIEADFERIDVPDASHKLECVVTGTGKVRLFGVTLEREPADKRYGVQVDGLGVGALNFEQMQHVDSKTRVEMLQHRRYDLVIFLLGTNMFVPSLHGKWVANVLKDFHAALPETPVLILSPPDIVLHASDVHSDPRIVAMGKQMKRIAADNGAAFWDFRVAMGGDAAIKKWVNRGLGARDYVHLTHDGGAIMGNRLVLALFQDMQGWLAEHPQAGCPAP